MSKRIKGGLYLTGEEKEICRSRKTITIQLDEWEKWVEIKDNRTWTQVMRQIREMAEEAEEYKNLIKQIALNAGTAPKTQGIMPIKRPKTKLTMSSLGVQSRNGSREFMKTLKKMELEGKDFKSLLTKIEDSDVSNIQKSDEELEKLKNKAFDRAEARFIKKEDLKPPP